MPTPSLSQLCWRQAACLMMPLRTLALDPRAPVEWHSQSAIPVNFEDAVCLFEMGAEHKGHEFLNCVSHFEMHFAWKGWPQGSTTVLSLESNSDKQTPQVPPTSNMSADACGNWSTESRCTIFRRGTVSSSLLSNSKSSGPSSRYISSMAWSWYRPQGKTISKNTSSSGGLGCAGGGACGNCLRGARELLRGGALGRGGLNEGSGGARGDTGIDGRTASLRAKRGGDRDKGGEPGYGGHSSTCWLAAGTAGRAEGEGRGPRGTQSARDDSTVTLVP